MSEISIKVVKLDCKNANGWGVHDGVVRIEVARPDWEELEKIAKGHLMSLDFVLAEAILNLFSNKRV